MAPQKAVFIDMKPSNNAARIRLWLALKEGVADLVDTRMIVYSQLRDPELAAVNPLMKVPAFIQEDGDCLFESNVILGYLEDKYSHLQPSFLPDTPEVRAKMELMIRIHDLYISSPNCNEPGFSHSQGGMYLSLERHGARRAMDLPTRAAKLAEIWRQLTWINGKIVGPYLCGEKVTLADLTWFPTCIFMEFMLPRVFGWPQCLSDANGPFPALAQWYLRLREEAAFAEVHNQIFGHWQEHEEEGFFRTIVEDVAADTTGLKFKYP